MPATLLRTKLTPPLLRRELVRRTRLEDKLQGALTVPLTLVSAPAGFGKSTAVLASIGSLAADTAWLSLDEQDDEPGRFWPYVVAAFERATGMKAVGEGMQSLQPPPLQLLLADVINALADHPRHVIFVLDDYHLISDKSIHEGMAFLLEHAPPNLHLLIITRADPPLPLHRLRARGQLLELRAEALRFTGTEAASLLREALALPLTDGVVAGLTERTEGWAAGLQLAALALAGANQEAQRQLVEGLAENHFILEYLTHEVLAQQPPELRAFLLQTSLLQRLNPGLCDAVTAREDSQVVLEGLAARNLFIVPLMGEGRWYRYHHLFARLLEGELRLQSPALAPVLQARAAAWYEAQGDTETAIHYALAAEDYPLAARLLEAAARRLVMEGRARTVENWWRRLPEAWREGLSQAKLALAWALLLRGQYTELGAHLDTLPEREDPAQAELHALRATLADSRGDAEAALVHARRALELASPDDLFAQVAAHMALAGAQRERGEVAVAIAAYERAIPLCRAAKLPVPEALARAHLGFMYSLRGQLRQAHAATKPAADLRHPAATAARLALLTVLLERNQLKEVAASLPEVLALAQRSGHNATHVQALLLHSRLCRAQGDRTGALAALEEAATRLELGAPAWLRPLLVSQRVGLWLEEGDLATAEGQLEGLKDTQGHVRELLPLMRARLLIHQATPEALQEALALLAGVRERSSDVGGLVLEALILSALARAANGEGVAALKTLRQALALAEREGYVRLFVEAGTPCARLLAQLATPYARELLLAFSPEVRAEVVEKRQGGLVLEPLTEREHEVLKLMAQALTYEAVAGELSMSVNTVRFHVKNLYGKLGATSRTEALENARALNIL